MVKRKRTKHKTTIHKTQHRKLRSNYTNVNKNRERTHVHQKGKQYQFHMWNLSCYSC